MRHDISVNGVIEWAEQYSGAPFHALLSDPPYHLTEMHKRFSSPNAKPAKDVPGGTQFARLGRGFMGQEWDGGEIAFDPATWEAIGRHLLPGAWCFAFSAARTYHRMATAIEEAGFEIQGQIAWIYASGFPKSTRIDTQVDRRLGAIRPVIGIAKHVPKFNAQAHGYRAKDNGFNSRSRESYAITGAGSTLAAAWAGHRYGVQALAPAHEPICVFRKPYDKQAIESILKHGAGALNIDAGRSTMKKRYTRNNKPGQNGTFNASGGFIESHPGGYWPKSVQFSHAPQCTKRMCVDGCPVLALERQVMGAAEFYDCHDFMLERIEEAPPFLYCSKPSMAEKEAGITGDTGTINDGRAKPIDNPYQRGKTERKNLHATLKPIRLARRLASILLPPDVVPNRSLLIPFSGVGSEMIGAGLAGWDYVHGVEFVPQYAAWAEQRIAHWGRRAPPPDATPSPQAAEQYTQAGLFVDE